MTAKYLLNVSSFSSLAVQNHQKCLLSLEQYLQIFFSAAGIAVELGACVRVSTISYKSSHDPLLAHMIHTPTITCVKSIGFFFFAFFFFIFNISSNSEVKYLTVLS